MKELICLSFIEKHQPVAKLMIKVVRFANFTQFIIRVTAIIIAIIRLSYLISLNR